MPRLSRSKFGLKLKLFFTLFLLVSGTLFFTVFHYGFSPDLLTKLSFYINLANPSVRIVRVEEGLRKEEVAEVVADRLGWDEKKKEDFINIHLALNTANQEGRYFPKTYLIGKDENPSGVGVAIFGIEFGRG